MSIYYKISSVWLHIQSRSWYFEKWANALRIHIARAHMCVLESHTETKIEGESECEREKEMRVITLSRDYNEFYLQFMLENDWICTCTFVRVYHTHTHHFTVNL